jgi:hypothetical protein
LDKIIPPIKTHKWYKNKRNKSHSNFKLYHKSEFSFKNIKLPVVSRCKFARNFVIIHPIVEIPRSELVDAEIQNNAAIVDNKES